MTDQRPKGPSATSLMKARRVLASLRSYAEVKERRERFPRPDDAPDRDDESDALQIAVELEYAAPGVEQPAIVDAIPNESLDKYITGCALYMESVITGKPMPPLPVEVLTGLRKYPDRAVAIVELLIDGDKLDTKKAALIESNRKFDS